VRLSDLSLGIYPRPPRSQYSWVMGALGRGIVTDPPDSSHERYAIGALASVP
jgi:hypothetical protein